MAVWLTEYSKRRGEPARTGVTAEERTTNPVVNPEFLAQVGRVVDDYLGIQSALAADDAAKAATAAKDTLATLASVDMELVTGDDHVAWMERAEALKSALSKVAQADGLETSRAAFAQLSEQMMAAAKRFGSSAGPLYQFKCPMAFDGRGAIWLQGRKGGV